MSGKDLDDVLAKVRRGSYVHGTNLAHSRQVESVIKPSINYSPSNPIETPYVGHECSISRQLLLQSQASEPLTQILDLFNIACLVKLLACLI
jgi:hypothetical protein